jgi:hypothetical protein
MCLAARTPRFQGFTVHDQLMYLRWPIQLRQECNQNGVLVDAFVLEVQNTCIKMLVTSLTLDFTGVRDEAMRLFHIMPHGSRHAPLRSISPSAETMLATVSISDTEDLTLTHAEAKFNRRQTRDPKISPRRHSKLWSWMIRIETVTTRDVLERPIEDG